MEHRYHCLQTREGYLLVDSECGTWCPVRLEEYDCIKAWLNHSDAELLSELEERLRTHGIFAGKRPFRSSERLIQIQVTNACNLRCSYCSACSGLTRSHELTLKDVRSVLREMRDMPGYELSFTGGEPLLVPWLFDAIDEALDCGMRVGLLSNLLLLKKNRILLEKLASRMRRGLHVQVSMSGSDRTVCERLSGCKCYDDALEILDELAREGVLPQLDVMMSAPDAQANIDAFSEFRRRLPQNMEITLGFIYPCGREKGEHVFCDNAKSEEVLDDIAFEGGVSIPAPAKKPVTNRRMACRCIENENIYIRSDGEIYSCFKMVECFGHLRDGIKTVLETRRKQPLFGTQLELCRACPFVMLCAGGCRADNIILSGDFRAPICGLWRKQLIAEMLFQDRPDILDWPVLQQLYEARKLGLEVPKFVVTEYLFSRDSSGALPQPPSKG